MAVLAVVDVAFVGGWKMQLPVLGQRASRPFSPHVMLHVMMLATPVVCRN